MKIDFNKLDRAFNPRCIAVVGDKGDSNFRWLNSLRDYKGKVYSVQIDPKEIPGIEALGVKNYLSLVDVPEPVDLAIVAVPRAVTPRILEDCIRKEVAAAHFFTAGFSESETEEGIRLERLLTERAEQANLHLIGPNCMGVFNPGVGVGIGGTQLSGCAGQVGFISQSGMINGSFNREANLHGVGINKSVSFGNGIVLGATEYLKYFGQDPEIKVIGMFLEGLRDGRQFLKVLKEVSARKPVVIWKGGRTEEGKRAIALHSGSLSMSQVIWDVAISQCGGIKATSIEELVDAVKALLFFPTVSGDRVAITGGSGGQSVVTADVFSESGLKIPELTPESYAELATFFTLIGGSYRNPVDTANPNNRQMNRILEILIRDKNIDNLVLLASAHSGPMGPAEALFESVVDIKKNTTKPVMVILPVSFSAAQVQSTADIMQRLQNGGVPVFTSLERGAFALKKALEYHSLQNNLDS